MFMYGNPRRANCSIIRRVGAGSMPSQREPTRSAGGMSERRSGGGRALMAYAEADATARGMTAVFLDARPDAIAFYQAPLGSGTIRRTLGAQADETASAVATSASAPCRSF